MEGNSFDIQLIVDSNNFSSVYICTSCLTKLGKVIKICQEIYLHIPVT